MIVKSEKRLTVKIKSKACGEYGTNCYIVSVEGKEFIIDPGMNAAPWVMQNVSNPVAILNTHGHFDHVWSNAELKKRYNIPIYAPEGDVFMLENDPFGQGTPSSKADVIIKGNESILIADVKIEFLHFPGHTPGCSVILIENTLFSGDFIFNNSIGRYDFPYSNEMHMRQSLERFLKVRENWVVYPGHGAKTTVQKEQANIPHWLQYF